MSPEETQASAPPTVPYQHVAKIAAALAKAQSKFVQPEKNKTVTVRPREGRPYSFDYADYGAIVKAVVGPLAENGICFTHLVERTQNGLALITKLIHESGQELTTFYPLPAASDPKLFGGAMTYGKRYSLSAITGCVADDDADAGGHHDGTDTTSFQDRQPPPPNDPPPPVQPKAQSPITPPAAAAPKPGPGQPGSTQGTVRVGPSEAQIKRLYGIAHTHGWNDEQVHLYMSAKFRIDSVRKLTRQTYDDICATMEVMSYPKACTLLVGQENSQS